jgi:hypothetical protein
MNKENFLFYIATAQTSLSLVDGVYCRKTKDAQKTAKRSCELVMVFFFVAFLPHPPSFWFNSELPTPRKKFWTFQL